MELTTKRKLIDTLGWGFILWLIAFILGTMLFPFVPTKFLGLFTLPVAIIITPLVAYKRFRNFGAPSSYYLLVATVWVLLNVVFDYLVIIKTFNAQNFYDLDLIIYYLATFLAPLIIGFKYGGRQNKYD